MDWKTSVYSDGSSHFVTPAVPQLGEPLVIRLQMRTNPEVRLVKLRLIRNGGEQLLPMAAVEQRGPLTLWQAETIMNQRELNYQFYLVTDTEVWYYHQAGLTDVAPTEERDFRLKAGYQTPAWVRKAVFYQIFPDRFRQARPELAVRDGEYTFDGHPTVRMAWDRPPKDYQDVFCLDFYGGDLKGVEEALDYLQDLGVTSLYLNPIFHSATSHRYDCLDFFHVDPHLGGDEALASLSAAVQARGMQLIVDVSINHTGTAHRWFNKEATFFPAAEGAYHNPESRERGYYFFGPQNDYHAWAGVKTLPTLNYTNQDLRDTLYRRRDSVVKKWLQPPYAIDGWRFDVANDMAKKDEVDLSHEVWHEIHSAVKETRPEAYLLAEHWTDSTAYLQGGEWDSAMNYYGSARPIRRFVGMPDLFYRSFPDVNRVRPPLTAPQFARWVTQHLSRIPWQNQVCQFNLLDSHDTDRLHNNPSITADTYEIAVQMLFTLPGTPNIYYGDEVGLDGRIDSHEGCRYPMEWDPGRWKAGFVGLYRILSRLKASSPCLQDGGFVFLYAEGFVVSWVRFTANEAVILVASMESEERTITLPVGRVGIGESWRFTEVLGRNFDGETRAVRRDGEWDLALPARRGFVLHGQV